MTPDPRAESWSEGRRDLAGKGVLVTRPAAQAEGLCRLIEAAGGRAIPFPAIAIEPVAHPDPVRDLFRHPWDLLVFISRNAVAHSLPLFPKRRLSLGPQLAAVGQATAAALATAGRAPDLMPAGRFDSESLLALPELMDMRNKRVLIVRGQGGRPSLGDALIERGAEVAFAEVYRRVLPEVNPAPLLARWRQEVQLATATSGEILDNLLTLVGRDGRAPLLATPLVVVSQRSVQAALNHGFVRVELAERASDEAILSALCRIAERPLPRPADGSR